MLFYWQLTFSCCFFSLLALFKQHIYHPESPLATDNLLKLISLVITLTCTSFSNHFLQTSQWCFIYMVLPFKFPLFTYLDFPHIICMKFARYLSYPPQSSLYIFTWLNKWVHLQIGLITRKWPWKNPETVVC